MNGNPALALALGAGAGFGLWYLLRDDDKKDPTEATSAREALAAPRAHPAQDASATAAAPSPTSCTLSLSAAGLTADGVGIDIPTAVARCQGAERAALVIHDGAPGAVAAELAAALAYAGVTVQPQPAPRNAGGPRRLATVGGVDLPAFAATVLGIARQVEPARTAAGLAHGRFGHKVFLSAIRRALADTAYATLSRAAIDRLLLDAHRAGLLRLARADLVRVMDPDEVHDSEIVDRDARYHVVLDDGRNAATHRLFMLRADPGPLWGRPITRWYRADPPTTWEDARQRLAAANLITEHVAWALHGDPPFRIPEGKLRPLPAGHGRNAGTHRIFILRTFPGGLWGDVVTRWYEADPPTTWDDARRRLVAAHAIDDRGLVRWKLIADPPFGVPEDRLRPLPGGDERNARAYDRFTLRTYPQGARGGGAVLRWFRADPPVPWAEARDRLIAAGIANPDVGGRTHEPGGWMLSVDPADYQEARAEDLP